MIGSGREFVFTLSGDEAGMVAATKRAQDALKGVTEGTGQLDRAQRGANSSSEQLLGGLEKLAGLATGGFFGSQIVGTFVTMNRALVDAQINADRLMLQLGAGVGAARAGQELDYVRQVSNRLGLELNTTAVSYARFTASAHGTSLEGQGVRQVFDSVSKAAAVMGLNVDETQGVLRALEQMMSKGTVQAEELRGQLGDRLPGALQIAARSLNVTTGRLTEMAQNGEVLASEFLPRFARQLEQELGGGAERAADRIQAANTRVANSWELLKQDVAASGVSDFMKGQLNVLADGLSNVAEKYRAARDSGAGFIGQTLAAAGAVAQFLNPFQALSYTAGSLDGKLQQAREAMVELKNELRTNPGNIFLQPAIKETQELIDKLEQAQRAKINLRAIDNATLARSEAQATEETARRKDALAKVTAELSGENGKLAKTLRVLADSYRANDLGESDYRDRVKDAIKAYGTKASTATPKATYPYAITDSAADTKSRFLRSESGSYEAIAKFEQQQQRTAEEQARREAAQYERRVEQAQRFTMQLEDAAARSDAQLISGDRARGEALLAIERAQLSARLALLELDAQDRAAAEDAIAAYMLARERQLTDELQPEWQRRLAAWADTTELMRKAYESTMDGFLDKGEDVFGEFLRTGKLNTRSLVNFIGDEFAKLAYRRFIAAPLAGALDMGLGALFGLFSGSGVGITSGNTGLADYGLGGGRAAGGGVQGGRAYPITEAGTPEVFSTSGGRRFIIPGSDGWVTPMRPGAAGGGGGGATVIQHVTYQVPAGSSPSAYAAALEENNRRLKAEMTADMARPGRAINRAAALAGA